MALIGRVVVGVLIGALTAALLSTVSAHAEHRDRWRQERAAQGTPAYDAAASDEAYEASRRHWSRAGLYGPLLASAVVLLLLTGAQHRVEEKTELPRLRVWASALLDVVFAGLIVSAAFLDDGESALVHAVARASPVLSAAVIVVPMVRFRGSPGLALVRGQCTTSAARSFLVFALLPLGVVWPGVHLRLVGLRAYDR
ncbi:MAG: hypothetical protein AAGE52_41885 [Myxococcota bacterium]